MQDRAIQGLELRNVMFGNGKEVGGQLEFLKNRERDTDMERENRECDKIRRQLLRKGVDL